MTVAVGISDGLARRILEHVHAGMYASLESAVEDLLRRGLAAIEHAPRPPPPPPLPPGYDEPTDDRPIDVNPARDVNWIGRGRSDEG